MVITIQADKGGSLVIKDRQDYLTEAYRLFGDTSTYVNLEGGLDDPFKEALKSLLDEALRDGVLFKSEWHFLFHPYPLTPFMYHIPKTHKYTTNPPGRPMISGIDSLISSMRSYNDHFLQKLVLQPPFLCSRFGPHARYLSPIPMADRIQLINIRCGLAVHVHTA